MVDSQTLLRRGVTHLLALTHDLEVVAEASSTPEALTLIDSTLPDLVILDISLPGRSGLDLLKELQQRQASLPVLIYTLLDEHLFSSRCRSMGAAGYLSKTASPEALIQTLRRIRAGQNTFPPAALVSRPSRHSKSLLDELTDREFEVFRLIGRGLPSTSIAGHLHISHKTVDAHRERLKRKLHLESATQLNLLAIRWVCSIEGCEAEHDSTPR